MARARNIKPGFFQNDELAEMHPLERLAFIGMWTIADFKGCIEYRPKMLKVQILPYDECDMEVVTNNLEQAGFIRSYAVQGKRYLKIINFEKHQNPHKNEREAGSEIPDIQEQDETRNENSELSQYGTKPDLIGTARADSLLLIPDSLNLIPDSRISPTALSTSPEKTGKADPLPCPVEKIVDLFHECLPENPRCKVINSQRRGLIRQRWREASGIKNQPFGYQTVEDGLRAWRAFFQVCNDSDFLTGKAPPAQGRPPFVATVDFLFSPSGFVKTLENRYHQGAA